MQPKRDGQEARAAFIGKGYGGFDGAALDGPESRLRKEGAGIDNERSCFGLVEALTEEHKEGFARTLMDALRVAPLTRTE